MKNIIGKINSLQSMGTLDGPGVRFVVFMQGCPLRCAICHNPETWDFNGGKDYSPQEILEKVLRYREYFKKEGGITVSGGEPLCQVEFVSELFRLCKENEINTCLDTSGCIFNERVENLLKFTDRVLLDVKYTDEENYTKYVGCKMQQIMSFLDYLEKIKIKTTLRQVIIPLVNGNKENIYKLKALKDNYNCVDKIELLPFKKICKVKYDQLKIDFPFKDQLTPDKKLMDSLNELL